MKRHEEMMAEDENRRIKDELVKTLLKNDPPKAPAATVCNGFPVVLLYFLTFY
jgi:hypothetical protein